MQIFKSIGNVFQKYEPKHDFLLGASLFSIFHSDIELLSLSIGCQNISSIVFSSMIVFFFVIDSLFLRIYLHPRMVRVS